VVTAIFKRTLNRFLAYLGGPERKSNKKEIKSVLLYFLAAHHQRKEEESRVEGEHSVGSRLTYHPPTLGRLCRATDKEGGVWKRRTHTAYPHF